MKRKSSPADLLTLIVLMAIGIFLGRVQTSARTAGRVDFVTSGVKTLLSPISRPLGTLSASSTDFFSGLFAARRLTEENRRLRQLAGVASSYTEQINRLEDEVERLRSMQKFGPIPGKVRVPAQVIGYSLFENRLTLDVGSHQGITVGAPVEAPDGLVGTVQTVEAERCDVQLLTSRGLTIGAIDMSRNPPPAALLRGESGPTLTLTFQDPKTPVEIGDRIATSGFSDRIPRGIMIGRVISVSQDEEFGSLRAKVDPGVNIGSLREVHVLR